MLSIKKTAVLATAAALSVTLVACGGSGTGPAVNPADTPQSLSAAGQYNPQPYDNIKDGGTLTTSMPEISAQFNLFQGDTTAYTRLVASWYMPRLITYTPTGEAVLNKDFLLDAKEETVDGKTRITYTLNPKAVYNDGAPIDWTSFDATWKANNGTNPAYIVSSSDGYSRITSVTKGVDDRQAIVTYDGINVWWQGIFGTLLNPKALDPEVFNKGFINTPHAEWGAGPYTISKFDQGNGTISFERNPLWWGLKGKLDTRTFLALETTANINAFKNGQIDAVTTNTADRLAQVKDVPNIEIRRASATSKALFTLNSRTPVLSDPAVRKAVMEGIDRNQFVKIAFQGLDYTEPLTGSLNQFSFQKGYQDNFGKVITYNPDAAKKGLDAAGWAPGPDGIRVKDGKPLTFSYVKVGADPVRKAMALATIAMLKDIGVNVEYKEVPSADFSKIIREKSFDIFFSGFSSSDPFGLSDFCQIWCSDSTLNLSGTADPAFDVKAKALNTLPTADEQYAKANELEVESYKTYGLMPLYNGPTIYAVKKGLANFGSGLFLTGETLSDLPQNVGWQK